MYRIKSSMIVEKLEHCEKIDNGSQINISKTILVILKGFTRIKKKIYIHSKCNFTYNQTLQFCWLYLCKLQSTMNTAAVS